MPGLAALLLGLLLFCIIAGLIYWIWTLLPGPQIVKNIVLIVLIVILIICILNYWPVWIGQLPRTR